LSLCGRLTALLAAALLAAALAACGKGGGAGGISEDDLASMVPTKADLGQDFAGFQESATLDTNEGRLQTADDPEDEQKDQQTFGRVVGYDRDLAASVATIQADAPLLIHIGVTLFKDGDGASGYLNDDIGDIQALVGRTDLGLVLEAVDRFEVPPLGDESMGLRTRASAPAGEGGPETVYVTYFWFRRDRIIGDVALARADDTDVSQQAETLASLLDERIQRVLSGPPTPLPTNTP